MMSGVSSQGTEESATIHHQRMSREAEEERCCEEEADDVAGSAGEHHHGSPFLEAEMATCEGGEMSLLLSPEKGWFFFSQ